MIIYQLGFKENLMNEKINEYIINLIADGEDEWSTKHDMKFLEYQAVVGALLDANLIQLP